MFVTIYMNIVLLAMNIVLLACPSERVTSCERRVSLV